jgi:3'(2'), 5'-bisphosphate nucleotidase
LAIPASQLSRRIKADGSSVTAADEASEAVILEALARLIPGVTVVSEEAAARAAPPALGTSCVLVDPLDGTREFLAGRDEFTVNLAIVTKGIPIAGIVAAPARGLLWRGVGGGGAERLRLKTAGKTGETGEATAIRTRRWPGRGAVATVSRSHLDPATVAYLARLGEIKREGCGSSLKFCKIAQGDADIYPRLAPTSEWDIAAGHAVLAAAGGIVTSADGAPLAYCRSATGFGVPAFIAWGDPAKMASLKA